MRHLIALAFFVVAMFGPILFGEAADAADVPDAFVAVVNEKSAEAMGDIGVFRDQLFRDHAIIVDQTNKIAELTKELEALKAVPPKADAPAESATPTPPTPPIGAMQRTHPHPAPAPEHN